MGGRMSARRRFNKKQDMSGLEIERKFLIREGSDYKSAAFSHSRIKQGYMPCQTASVRVRTRDDRSWLTIKSHSDRAGLSRYEFEKEITNDEAEPVSYTHLTLPTKISV